MSQVNTWPVCEQFAGKFTQTRPAGRSSVTVTGSPASMSRVPTFCTEMV